jgi:predicted MPP superfamily phosphohydrolase
VGLIALIGFGAVVLLAMALLHGYLWWRLVRGTTCPGRRRRLLTLLTVVLALLPVAVIATRGRLPRPVETPLEWVGYTWLGLVFYLFLATLATEPIRVALRLFRRSRAAEAEGAGLTRRRFLALGAGALAVGVAGTGVVLANSAPVVRRVPISIPRLDPALAGLRIVTFSDGHLSATYGGRRFERVVETVNAQRPDVVAIVGDLVDGEVDELREDAAPLADLVSEQGVFFVTGNHEYFVDTRAWLRHLSTLGLDVLRNERVAIRRGGASFDLAGIDDRTAQRSGLPGHGADLDAALDGRDDAVPVVLLAHQPVQVAQARAAGVDLQLSGHTHGGQLWPFDYAVLLDQPVVEGWSQQGPTQLYVTAGAGNWGPQMRVGARPEVIVIELQPGDPAEPGR